ncbi:MAG TPA: sodium:proton exchanger [Flavobacteriales bacterium]|nr:sodium:proton exchanger [Flavobacteriales bacterium]
MNILEVFNSYVFIIAVSVIIILSYFFNLFSKKTNIPSVLMLILLGMLLQIPAYFFDFNKDILRPVLEILGIVGLIMIVLEAALDLKLTKEKWPTIWKSSLSALLGLLVTAFAIAAIFNYFLGLGQTTALIYAIPLAIMSSAIVIPSVENIDEEKKEFMIYESTIADILGIMFFYLLIANAGESSTKVVILDVVGNISWTISLSIIVSYLLVFVFQNIKTEVKLFLLIAVLLLLYSIGKLLSLSSLLIILVFGVVLQNSKLFFFGFMKKWLKPDAIKVVLKDFKLITSESSFVVRSFFFVIFGITLSLSSLLSIQVFLISGLVLGSIYLLRFAILKLIIRKDLKPQLYIAPRGLVTILLFFGIPEENVVEDFESGILLFTIIVTSIIMTVSLIKNSQRDGEESTEDMVQSEESSIL